MDSAQQTSQLNEQQQFAADAQSGFMQIFEIVGHTPEEAKHHADLILERINQIALTLLLMKKPTEERQTLIESLTASQNFTELQALISEQFSEAERSQAFADATEKVMKAYFDEIKKDLAPEQLQDLQLVLLQLIAKKEPA